MSWFKIDSEKCNLDGLCAIECPAHIIQMAEQGPVPVEGGQDLCIQCGHCVAVCPEAAFTLETLSPQACMPIQKELMLDEIKTEHFLRSRRAVRRFRKKPVPRDVFQKVLDIACCAPTGSNRQPVQWLIIDREQDIKKMASMVIDWMRHVSKEKPEIADMLNMHVLISQWESGVDRICRNAPQLVFAFASNEVGSASADCHIALSYLELALPGFGLGSCWAGYLHYAALQWPELAEELNFPLNHTCHGALMVGVPKITYYRAPGRKPAKIHYHAG